MDSEKQATETPTVITAVPPSYSVSSSQRDEHTFKLRMTVVRYVGIFLMTALLVGGFIATVVVVMQNRSSDTSGGQVEESKVEDGEVVFEVNGENKTESVHIDEEADIVIIEDTMDHFTVVLDYKRGLAVFKNLTSSICYFTNLDAFPVSESTTGEKTRRISPVLFTSDGHDSRMGNGTKMMTVKNKSLLPGDYVEHAQSEAVMGMCSGRESYWVTIEDNNRVKRYWYPYDYVCHYYYSGGYYYGYCYVWYIWI